MKNARIDIRVLDEEKDSIEAAADAACNGNVSAYIVSLHKHMHLKFLKKFRQPKPVSDKKA